MKWLILTVTALHAQRLHAGGAAQYRRLSAARHVGNVQRRAAKSPGHHSVHAVAAATDRFVRGRAHRHRQLQREGHHRQGHVRRPPQHRQRAEARVRRQIKVFVKQSNAASHTDITGGLLQAIEFLNEKGSGRKTVLIFSDLQEDLAKGYIRDVPMDLKGFEVVALNVTKLRTDNFDPREYLARVDSWRERVEKSGGRWRMINDLERLDGLL